MDELLKAVERIHKEMADRLFSDENLLKEAITLGLKYENFTIEQLGEIYIFMVNLRNKSLL